MCRQRARLAEEVQWAQQYAAMNRIALQRLLEQHDRGCAGRAGARFLKVRTQHVLHITLLLLRAGVWRNPQQLVGTALPPALRMHSPA